MPGCDEHESFSGLGDTEVLGVEHVCVAAKAMAFESFFELAEDFPAYSVVQAGHVFHDDIVGRSLVHNSGELD